MEERVLCFSVLMKFFLYAQRYLSAKVLSQAAACITHDGGLTIHVGPFNVERRVIKL